jgi:nicotinamide mononucleotide (NMN) deamidase PncC
MPDSTQQQIVEQIHASGRQLVIAVTGGGSRAISVLLAVPGASATVLEAVVPYSLAALEDWLGGSIDHACSERTARAMAMAAFERVRQLSPADPHTLVGVGVTASLVSTRPKRGPHRIHFAWQSATATVAYSVELVKSQRVRVEEEAVAAELVLESIAEACEVIHAVPLDPSSNERIERREKIAPVEWTELLLNQRRLVEILVAEATRPNRHIEKDARDMHRAIFSGAFNPLHTGHRRMADLAADRLKVPVALELSITNVDKPPLDFLEIDDRLQQLVDYPVLLTRAATFVEKAAILPGSTFVVGVDTLARIAVPAYYGGSAERRDAAIAAIASSRCRFLVFGRIIAGCFTVLANLDLPPSLRALCDEVPESEFRDDSASTKLRVGE